MHHLSQDINHDIYFYILVLFSRNGATRSGMFCVINFILEKMKIDQEVDITLAVKKIRAHRPEAICNLVRNLSQFSFLLYHYYSC